MLLASAPRSTRARWLGASTLVLAMALAAPTPADAQDGTVYIGGGSNSQDGTRGVQGRDNVIVNMDAIDGGRGRAGNSSSRDANRSAPANQPEVEFGEPYLGPAGAILRFPPERPPQSQLTVDPDQLPEQRRASQGTQPADPTPARKPQRPAQPQQRMTATAPDVQTEPSSDGRAAPRSEPQESVEVPDAPSLEPETASEADADTRTVERAEPESEQPSASGTAPTRLTARPARKPQPPQGTRTVESAAAQPTETAARSEAASGETPPEPATASGAEADDAADSQAAEAPASDAPSATTTAGSEPRDTAAETSETATAAPAEPSGGSDSGTETSDTAGSGDTEETQTASLPPSGLPEQMRLMFGDGSATLSDGAKQQLDQLAQVLEDNPRQRVQLMAFAQGTEDTASQARRLSLSRALAVRTYLIDQGIRSTRMDVRALGATADQGPLDRVDIVPANR